MPLYEYYCPPCATQFEVLRPMKQSDEPAVCPSGHQTTNRVLSLFATIRRTPEGAVSASEAVGACCAGGACTCGARA